MIDKDPNTIPWLQILIPSFLVSVLTFVGTMLGFKAKSTEKDKNHERAIEDVNRKIEHLDNVKASNEKIEGIWSEVKRLDGVKAEKEVVNMIATQLQTIDAKLSQLLSEYRNHK